MKKVFVILFLILPGIISAQLNIDGKTEKETKNYDLQDVKTNSLILSYYIGDDGKGIGIKYQYFRKIGLYFEFKSSFSDSQYPFHVVSLGPTLSIGNVFNLFIGAGYNICNTKIDYVDYFEEWKGSLSVDVGILLKIKSISFNFTLSFLGYEETDINTSGIEFYHNNTYSTLGSIGIGYNF